MHFLKDAKATLKVVLDPGEKLGKVLSEPLALENCKELTGIQWP